MTSGKVQQWIKQYLLKGRLRSFKSHLACIGFFDFAQDTFDILTQDYMLTFLGPLLMYF